MGTMQGEKYFFTTQTRLNVDQSKRHSNLRHLASVRDWMLEPKAASVRDWVLQGSLLDGLQAFETPRSWLVAGLHDILK